jgi:hypothetical protein
MFSGIINNAVFSVRVKINDEVTKVEGSKYCGQSEGNQGRESRIPGKAKNI